MTDAMIRYTHFNDKKKKVWFKQYAKDRIPPWAANIEPHVEDTDNDI